MEVAMFAHTALELPVLFVASLRLYHVKGILHSYSNFLQNIVPSSEKVYNSASSQGRGVASFFVLQMYWFVAMSNARLCSDLCAISCSVDRTNKFSEASHMLKKKDSIPLGKVALRPHFSSFSCYVLIPHAWIIREVVKNTLYFCKR
jgi:hypothetical protein